MVKFVKLRDIAEKKAKESDGSLTWLLRFVKDLRKQRYYGKLIISFKDGRMVHANKDESIIPEN